MQVSKRARIIAKNNKKPLKVSNFAKRLAENMNNRD